MEDSCKDTVGIVFVGLPQEKVVICIQKEYADGTPHQLALTEAEKETIQFAKDNCTGVVVVINSTNAMQIPELEDDEQINAILQICTPGAMGFKSLGKILNGTVCPSGRTVDTFVANNQETPTLLILITEKGTQYMRMLHIQEISG